MSFKMESWNSCSDCHVAPKAAGSSRATQDVFESLRWLTCNRCRSHPHDLRMAPWHQLLKQHYPLVLDLGCDLKRTEQDIVAILRDERSGGVDTVT